MKMPQSRQRIGRSPKCGEQPTVILAAGDFPRKGTEARQILERASRVVCCDSAADAYRKNTGREPTVVIGDGDSAKGKFANLVRVEEQETNDLEKAIRFCATEGWKNPVVLGATGKREDHAIGNVFRCMEHGLTIVTDYGHFVPFGGAQGEQPSEARQPKAARPAVFKVHVGASVSIFANPGTRMKSAGLEWPLDNVVFENFHCATLNRASATRIRIWSSKKAYAYFAN